MISTWVLSQMGIFDPQIGMSVTFSYQSGDYSTLRTDNRGSIYVSESFAEGTGIALSDGGSAMITFVGSNNVQWADKNNIELITLSGGKVFCILDDIKYFEFARACFRGKVSIITNAALIRQEHIGILQRCVDEISISLDGYDRKSVDFIRGTGVFEKVINTVQMLKNNRIENIVMTMVLTSDNRNRIYVRDRVRFER